MSKAEASGARGTRARASSGRVKRSLRKVAPGVWRLRLGEPEAITPFGLRQKLVDEPKLDAMTAMPSVRACPIPSKAVKFEVTARGCRIELPMDRDEHLFGLGLQLKSCDQTMLKKTLRCNSDPAADTGDSHAPSPWYVSTAGYGVLVDTARYATFYMGSHAKVGGSSRSARADDEVEATLDEGATEEANLLPDSVEALYRQRAVSDRRVVIETPSASGVDVYIFAGPDMMQAVQRYTLFSGGGCLPALWGLGPWYRTWTKHDQKGIETLAGRLRDSQIPVSVIGLEPGWQAHTYSCSYTWSPERFPDPQGLIDVLRGWDYHVNLWEHVFTHPSSPLYTKMRKYCGDYEVWGGVAPDLSIDKAREAFASYHAEQFVRKGVTGFKADECDNSDFIWFPWSFPEASSFPSGMDGEQMHSLLGLLYQATLYEALRGEDVRTLCQVRSSGPWTSSMPFVLYSDLYDHREFIRGVVTSGFSGMLWSPELRQCRSIEDMVRRIQSVILSPQALVNAWMIKHPPWMQVEKEKNNRDEMMPGRRRAETIVRSLFRFRMSLTPYLYAAFLKYHEQGVPVCRALVMDWPDDARAWKVDDQWMIGDALMFAPLVAGETGRQVYLPEGLWYDFHTRQPLEGGRVIEREADLESMLLFVRDGCILPLAEPVMSITPETVFDLTVHTFGCPCRPLRLLEDDGVTYGYQRGESNTVTLRYDRKGEPSIVREGGSAIRRYAVNHWRHIGG